MINIDYVFMHLPNTLQIDLQLRYRNTVELSLKEMGDSVASI